MPAGDLQVMQAGGKTVSLSARQLADLPQQNVKTATQWTDGVKVFQGPLVTDVVKAAGFQLTADMTVRAVALNGYEVDIPAGDFLRWPVILAWSMDGKVFTRRDKGPLWVVYPRDSDKSLHDAKYDHRWAWQLRQLTLTTTH